MIEALACMPTLAYPTLDGYQARCPCCGADQDVLILVILGECVAECDMCGTEIEFEVQK